MNRKNDKADQPYFRSDRLFFMNGKWYFASREGDMGPYVTREYAERMLARFLLEKVELASFQESREQRPANFAAYERADRAMQLKEAAATRSWLAPELFI